MVKTVKLLKILVVEDDNDDFLLLNIFLKKVKTYSFHVTRAECVMEAVNLLINGYYRIFSRLASLNYFCYFVATI
jgi:hypothetical protein